MNTPVPELARASWPRLAAGLVAGSATSFAALSVLAPTQAILLGLVALFVVLWTNEGLPLGAVSLLPLVLFPVAGIADMTVVAANYANPVIFLFLGGFMLAIAVEKTRLHEQIAYRLLAVFPHTARGAIFALAMVSGLLSAFLSNTTTALLLMPLAMFLSSDERMRLRLALAIAYGASLGGVMTPIGTPPNLILMGFQERQGLVSIGFVHWIVLMLPLAGVMLIAVAGLLARGAGSVPLVLPGRPPPPDGRQRRLALILLALVGLLVVNSPLRPYHAGLGLDERAILLAFGLSMLLPRFGMLNWADCRRIPYEILFLFGAGFAIAQAFTTTGLADAIAGGLLTVTHLDAWLLVILVAALATFATEVTSNTALISMLLPVVYAVTESSGLDTRLFLLVATVCSSYAFMLPIATPPNAIAVASGVLRPLDMLRFGLPLNIVGVLLVSVFALAYWRLVL